MAREFHNSACITKRAGCSFTATYYLFGHSIELSLKAFLLKSGISATVLKRRPFCHDLEALLERSIDLGIRDVWRDNAHDALSVHWLNQIYSEKWLEYPIINGAWNLPRADDLEDLSGTLWKSVDGHVKVRGQEA